MSRACIAMAVHDEAHWLRLHLPVLAATGLDFVALDGGSQDDSLRLLRRVRAKVFQREFDWNFSAHMNFLLECCESEGYDSVIRLDPDEIMFPNHILAALKLLDRFAVIRLARITFEPDRLHYCPNYYPDWQTRVFRLGIGIRYSGKVHETVEQSLQALGLVENLSVYPDRSPDIVRIPHLPIYHYEGLRSDKRRALKFINYERIQQGLPPLEIDEFNYQNHVHQERFNVPFLGQQPIDPQVVGPKAPFQELRS